MTDFSKVQFKGTFRDYQRRVLDNADKYLKDGKINIVAAPGSGKTILGLELIRRLGSPCIVLSPTTAIRQQWGERFAEMFLDDGQKISDFCSGDLHDIKLLNSITYQALYTAIEKVASTDDEDVDCSDIDIFATMKHFGIKTVCLDEAHHLKNEWQKSLEKFISYLDSDIKIISLTATPPYDSEGSEWTRYMKICGEIDEEIFVPELVGRNNLCPHQDYVYFNFPTETEIKSLGIHKEKASFALAELKTLNVFTLISKTLNAERDYEKLFSDVKGYIALMTLLRHFGFDVDKKLIRELTADRGLPSFSMKYAEVAVQFVLDGDLLTEKEKEKIISVLKKYSVYEKKKVTFCLNERLKRTLISSVGKLDSITSIAKSEINAMGSRLRMLVLTDYIKKENLSKIATDEELSSVNIVSIFETLRRAELGVNIGVLSGTLVILPRSIDLSSVRCKASDIEGTDYCVVDFVGATHRSVDYVGRLFAEGKLQILIGTKSLLGEGWDSPCINSLVLASFVGSFVLSNQMRGRAIRIDKNDPEKSANIWHLVTVEPDYLFKEKLTEKISSYITEDYKELISYDYEMLKRRFDSFMGPNYSSGEIESGVERLTLIKPPFNKEGIGRINEGMLKMSADRSAVREKWIEEVSGDRFEVHIESEVTKEKRVPIFTFWNVGLCAILTALEVSFAQPLINANIQVTSFEAFLLIALMIGVGVLLTFGFTKLLSHINPARSIKTLGTAVYKTLRECELISPEARVEVKEHKELMTVSVYLKNATIHDQNVFNTAMAEMLSPIDNPRYILISRFKNWYNYELSFACPAIIGKKKEYVDILKEKLRLTTGGFEPVYTHSEGGRRLILKCRKRSYITFNQKQIEKKYKVSHWE